MSIHSEPIHRSRHQSRAFDINAQGFHLSQGTLSDRRSGARSLETLQQMANASAQVNSLKAIQAMADRRTQSSQIVQRQQLVAPSFARRENVAQLQSLGTGQVIQRFDPFSMGLLGAGLAGGMYGAYRYFRHRQRENALDAIHDEQANGPPTVVNMNNVAMDSPSLVKADQSRVPQNARTYTIDLNQNNPVGRGRTSPEELRIAEIHERTHISADQAYSANANESLLELFHEDPAARGAAYLPTYTGIDNRTQRLAAIVKGDKALGPQQRAEILNRIDYATKPVEYDPVVNELLAYTREYGIRANSTTVKALVVLANENLARRQPGSPTMSVDPVI